MFELILYIFHIVYPEVFSFLQLGYHSNLSYEPLHGKLNVLGRGLVTTYSGLLFSALLAKCFSFLFHRNLSV